MTYDEFTVKIREILTKLESPEDVGAIIDELSEAYKQRDTEATESAAKVVEMNGKIDRLQKANMELYLRTGVKTDEKELDGAEEEKDVDFSELFNEKGEIE